MANSLPDLLVDLAPPDLRPNFFCLAGAVVGFPVCATHDDLISI